MPEQSNDDGLVPPIKVLRRRLNGVYRADGLSGPTRRYVLIVALLVGLASLPTLAAITAGRDELDDGSTGAMDVPFLPPPSTGPVIPVPVSPAPQPGIVHGQRGGRKTEPDDSYGHSIAAAVTAGGRSRGGSSGSPESGSPASHGSSASGAHGSQPSGSGSSGPDRPAGSGSSGSGGSPGSSGDSPGAPDSPSAPGAGPDDGTPPGHPVPAPDQPADPSDPSDPSGPSGPADPEDMPNPPSGLPFCHERGECGSRESRHHRPDWFRHRQCEDSPHRAHGSHHREGRTRQVLVDIVPTGRHGRYSTIGEQPTETEPTDTDQRRLEPLTRSIIRHRSSDRSESSRSSTMTERPQNARPARVLERTHNSRRHHAGGWSDSQTTATAYRGSHRADRRPGTDGTQTAAQDRSSRVGRHHADRYSSDEAARW